MTSGAPEPIQVYIAQDNFPNMGDMTVTVIQRCLQRQRELCTQQKQQWPEVLFLQFDNSSKENKNQKVFKYLSLLVHLNVFRKIKINTGLVIQLHCD